MRYLTGWFIRNPVAANLLMAFILLAGIVTVVSIRIEGFPRLPPDSITITTSYPGASTAQVDELVTRKVEKALEGVEGVHSITSQSEEEVAITVERKTGGQNLRQLLDKVRLRIDGITALPTAVRRPVIETNGYDFPALYLNIHGETDPATLQTLSERLREDLLARPELSRLKVWGLHEREVRIEIAPYHLERLNLSVADIVTSIRASSLHFRPGALRTSGGRIILRTDRRARYVTEFEKISVISVPDGGVVHLGDIATIRDTFREGDYRFRFNGRPTTGMEVLVGQRENLLHISEVVHDVVRAFQPQLPSGIEITVWGDASNYISDRLDLLRLNGIQGLILVMLILSLFLNVRLAFWVGMGIPISLMGAIAVAGSKWVDYSLNDVTTFGLIIALGILLDDAVVVGESVHEHQRKIPDPIRATEAGVNRVSIATVFGVLTTIAAFFPMLLLDNPLGKALAGFSGIVILALIFSLIESKFILPAHLAYMRQTGPVRSPVSKLWEGVQRFAQGGLHWFRDQIYAPVLVTAIRHRYAALVLFVAAGTMGIGLIGYGKIKTVFFPDVPGQIVTINLEMDARAPFRLTKSNVEHIQSIGEQLNVDLRQQHAFDTPPIRAMFVIISSARTAQIIAELTPVAQRPAVGILDIIRDWRQRTGQIEGAVALQFSGTEDIGGGFRLRLFSRDADILDLASKDLTAFLSGIRGVSSIRNTLASGRPELDIRLKPEARSLGFDTQRLASQIGRAFGGAEAQKIQRDRNEVRVVVQNAKTARDSIDDLVGAHIRNKAGDWIALQSVAELSGRYVPATVRRHNGKLVSTVAAAVDRSIVAPEEVAQAVFAQVMPGLLEKYPGIEIKRAGELEEMGEIQDGMKRALILATALIYVLMAIPLKSYWQPILILAIVPFGFIGAALGHLIMDLSLSVLSFFGMLALTGVVINDSLVMMTRYNQARSEGKAVNDALRDAGVGRFKAIFLTTATTVIGLAPLLTETSEQAQYLIPAAASLAFGELFSTVLLLLLMPALIAITEDVKHAFRKPQVKTNVHAEG